MRNKLLNFKSQYCALIKKKNLSGYEAMAAVAQNSDALRFVKDQTAAICMAAVAQDGYALQYVKDQTEVICMAAVAQEGNALRFVEDHWFYENHTICIDGKNIEVSHESFASLKLQLIG